MRTAIALVLSVIMVSPTLAALPPQYQRAAELKAAIDAATEALKENVDPVTSVRFLETDSYEVQSEKCTVVVDIVDEPPATDAPMMVGPRQFKAVAQDPSCS